MLMMVCTKRQLFNLLRNRKSRSNNLVKRMRVARDLLPRERWQSLLFIVSSALTKWRVLANRSARYVVRALWSEADDHVCHFTHVPPGRKHYEPSSPATVLATHLWFSFLSFRSGYALKIVSTSNLFLLVYVFLIHACLTLTDCNLKQESGQRCNLIAIENFLWRKRCRISAYDISYTFHPILNWMYNICCHADGSSLPNLSISL